MVLALPDLEVQRGEAVLVVGPSGCGKSTLAAALAGLEPGHAGVRRGTVSILGVDPFLLRGPSRVRAVGFVDQRPEDQVLTGTVGDEVAFACISAGMSWDAARAAGASALERVGLARGWHDPVHTLSGGERQRLAIAAALAPEPALLVLDEPLAHLDPDGADRALRAVRAAADAGTAVVLVEHRRALALPFASREVELAPALPAPAPPRSPPEPGEDLIVLLGASWRYPGATSPTLAGVDLRLRRGERWVVTGPNGAGKTTLMAMIRKAAPRGVRVIPVPQDPDLALSATSVARELRVGPAEAGFGAAAAEAEARRVARIFGLEALWDRAPQALSRGERLRVAVAAAVAARPDVLLLDEPTAGQDPARVALLLAEIAGMSSMTVVVATHDPACAATLGARRLQVAGGAVREAAP